MSEPRKEGVNNNIKQEHQAWIEHMRAAIKTLPYLAVARNAIRAQLESTATASQQLEELLSDIEQGKFFDEETRLMLGECLKKYREDQGFWKDMKAIFDEDGDRCDVLSKDEIEQIRLRFQKCTTKAESGTDQGSLLNRLESRLDAYESKLLKNDWTIAELRARIEEIEEEVSAEKDKEGKSEVLASEQNELVEDIEA